MHELRFETGKVLEGFEYARGIQSNTYTAAVLSFTTLLHRARFSLLYVQLCTRAIQK